MLAKTRPPFGPLSKYWILTIRGSLSHRELFPYRGKQGGPKGGRIPLAEEDVESSKNCDADLNHRPGGRREKFAPGRSGPTVRLFIHTNDWISMANKLPRKIKELRNTLQRGREQRAVTSRLRFLFNIIDKFKAGKKPSTAEMAEYEDLKAFHESLGD